MFLIDPLFLLTGKTVLNNEKFRTLFYSHEHLNGRIALITLQHGAAISSRR